MDYKYITQLLDRYWKAETTVEEENILRAFFSQTSVPEELKQYRCLFLYQATEPKTDVLDAAFDDRLLAIVGEEQKDTAKVKAHPTKLNNGHQPRPVNGLHRFGNHRHATAAHHGHHIACRQRHNGGQIKTAESRNKA